MNKIISVSVKDKIAAQTNDVMYICGNSDFVVDFDFDDEWSAFAIKTARFIHNGTYIDVVFSGERCAVPVMSDTHCFRVGVFAGNLHTTTSAYIPAKKSILCDGGVPDDPAPDVYNQIMDRVNEVAEDALKPVSWNDLQDKPFEGDYVEVVPEQTVGTTEQVDGIYTDLSAVGKLEVGTVYAVKFNEDEYECIAYHPIDVDDMVNEGITVLGDCSHASGVIPGLHGESNNEPFAVIQQVGNFVLYANQEGNHTIAVGIGHLVKLDNKYLDMDAVPTDNSGKPVTSGGVATSIKGLASEEFVRKAIAKAEQTVVKHTAQTLTDEQKEQARKNIGAVATNEVVAEQMQADWNQSDSTKPDYVKNRPFYVEGETVIVEEQTVTTSGERYEGSCACLSEPEILEVDKIYKVVFDGTAYECVAYHPYEDFEDGHFYDDYFVIGNSILLAGIIPGIGHVSVEEPFAIIQYAGITEVYVAKDGEYTVKVTGGACGVVIDPAYQDAIKVALPTLEMVATFDDGTTATYTLFGEVMTE